MNNNNSAIVTQYESIIYDLIWRCDTKLITNIFREAFKRTQEINLTNETEDDDMDSS